MHARAQEGNEVFALWRMWKRPDPGRGRVLGDWMRAGGVAASGAWTQGPSCRPRSEDKIFLKRQGSSTFWDVTIITAALPSLETFPVATPEWRSWGPWLSLCEQVVWAELSCAQQHLSACTLVFTAVNLGTTGYLLLFVLGDGTRWHSGMYNYKSMRELGNEGATLDRWEASQWIYNLSFLELTILMYILQSSSEIQDWLPLTNLKRILGLTFPLSPVRSQVLPLFSFSLR